MARKHRLSPLSIVAMAPVWCPIDGARSFAAPADKTQGPRTTDQLDYLADLISELHTMAIDAGCARLAHLLAEAGEEARLQIEVHET